MKILVFSILMLCLMACATDQKSTTANASSVEDTMMSHKDRFRECYEQSSKQSSGRINTAFTIGKDGRVNKLRIVSSTLKQSDVEACILKTIQSLNFDPPKGGGSIEVTYPFKFSPTPGN